MSEEIYSEGLKEVYFDQWCGKCQYAADLESDPKSPCWECLDEGTNLYSHKPTNFKEKE